MGALSTTMLLDVCLFVYVCPLPNLPIQLMSLNRLMYRVRVEVKMVGCGLWLNSFSTRTPMSKESTQRGPDETNVGTQVRATAAVSRSTAKPTSRTPYTPRMSLVLTLANQTCAWVYDVTERGNTMM